MTLYNKTIKDLNLEKKLSENTICTLNFMIAHYNHTGECFHVFHDTDSGNDTVCRLCDEQCTADKYIAGYWNYHHDQDNGNSFTSLSDKLIYTINLKQKNKIAKQIKKMK